MSTLQHGFALFDTAIGAIGIAWGPHDILGAQLPEADLPATRRRMRRRFPGFDEIGEQALAPAVRRVIEGVQALLQGAPRDLLEVVLDEQEVPEFHRRVYALTRRIRPGQTRSYGELAAELGDKGLARAVGQALGLNPFAPIVPCHRVLAADHRPGGFSAHGGALAKLRMLAIEGAAPGGTPSLFDDF